MVTKSAAQKLVRDMNWERSAPPAVAYACVASVLGLYLLALSESEPGASARVATGMQYPYHVTYVEEHY